MGLAVYFLWSAHHFASSGPNFCYEIFQRSRIPAAEQEEHLQTGVFFHFSPYYPCSFYSWAMAAPTFFLFIVCCHVILFVSEMLPCLTCCLPSSSSVPSNCHSMPWGFPSPICLKSLLPTLCYFHCEEAWPEEAWPNLHNAVLSKEKKQKLSFCFTWAPHVWAWFSAAPVTGMDCRYFSISLILHLNWKSCLGRKKEILLQVTEFCCREQ